MNSSSRNTHYSVLQRITLATACMLLLLGITSHAAHAQSGALKFQRPGSARAANESANKNFRRPGVARTSDEVAPSKRVASTNSLRQAPTSKSTKKKSPQRKPKQIVRTKQATTSSPAKKPASQRQVARRDQQVTVASSAPVIYEPMMESAIELSSYGCDVCDGPCMCDASCGCPEPSCGICEPTCGCGEPSCGICEPSCGLYEPGCGIAEPSCGCGDVGCGSCCARPGPDYWCFPICLPRFKDLSVFAGVEGFRGPRDFTAGRSDSNFGFNQGINISGRAPLVGLLFPQLSYQLGYRATQTRLHGTTSSVDDRSQQFVTAGLFRRVNTGLQFGAVWDMLRDDLDQDVDLQQIRYEISLKSPQGREIGFFGTSSTNDALSAGILYETTDQYAMFYRWKFGNGYESRLWGGASGSGEGIFGGEFYAPMSSRWALQSGFNYLVSDEQDGRPGVSEESWNVGINMVWHLGKTARRGCRSPYRPMFSVADNGWMFVNQAQ